VDVSSRLRDKDGGIGGIMGMHEMGTGDVSHDLCAGQHLHMLLCLNNVDGLWGQACLGRHYGERAVLAEEEGDFAAVLDFFDLDARSGRDEHLVLVRNIREHALVPRTGQ
jgi:hypothetical protein